MSYAGNLEMSCSVDKVSSMGLCRDLTFIPFLSIMLHEDDEKRLSMDYLQPLKGE